MNHVSPWRIVAAVAVLAGLAFFAALFAPIYIRDHQLHGFVDTMMQQPDIRNRPDDVLRSRVLDKARELNLPVTPGDVRILRSPEGMRIDVRYYVRVNLPGYTVDLHFYPGAGRR
ncbi:MAG TPA: hypothetical protein VG675_10500 [Bryobacteraceae bacterium]|nr:hypothetical protein [Bryobacteraceae bacterium]